MGIQTKPWEELDTMNYVETLDGEGLTIYKGVEYFPFFETKGPIEHIVVTKEPLMPKTKTV